MLALMNKGKTKEKPYFHGCKAVIAFLEVVYAM